MYQKKTPPIDLRYIDVKADSFITSLEFINSLQLKDTNKHFLASCGLYIYTFKVCYNNKQWLIKRRVQDFQDLEKAVSNDPLFRFKSKSISKENVDNKPQKVMEDLLKYLLQILKQEDIIENPPSELLFFLELSNVEYGSNVKYKECFLKKKAGGRFAESKCARCGTLWGKWDSRYFLITSEAVMYSKGPDPQHCQVREVLTFDYNFTVLHGKTDTGHERGIILNTTARQLVLNAQDLFSYILFLAALQDALRHSPYMTLHRFDSFAPERHQQFSKWYIDGAEYFGDVQKAILNAKHSVFITDWWLSPELYLSRPVAMGEDNLMNRESRLDLVLKNVADRGIQVQILVYQEPTLALNNDSMYTKTYLESLSVNVQVLRHPSQTIPQLWSHHEKMVVIDQTIGFLGGLDLCYGRYDNQKHPLYDQVLDLEIWPGIDYSNMRKKDFVNVRNHQVCQLNKHQTCRMPWHDIAMQVMGDVVTDLSRHFIQYWNHVIIEQNFKQRAGKRIIQGSPKKVADQNSYHKLSDSKNTQQTFIGKEFEHGHYDAFIKKLEEEIRPQFSISGFEEDSKPQIQYEDEEQKQQEAKIDYPQGKRRITLVNEQHVMNKEILQIMKTLNTPVESEQETQYYKRFATITHEYQPVKENHHHTMIQNQPMAYKTKYGDSTCQMLRSASTWSVGCKPINNELSIQVAYIQLIGEAKHFIYIENQFFISGTAGVQVENKVAQALISRIKEAAKYKQRFKVIVFLPLLPGFEGEIDDNNSAVMKVQLHWEYYTISRGGSSILEQLRRHLDCDPADYIEFYSLRTHALNPIDGTPTTEIIYIHSKLMIIDDEIVLMGSANINDRSLLGNRDSEIAMLTEDKSKVQSLIGGQASFVSKFAHTLRTSLYQEHFGLEYKDVQDPLSLELQEQIRFQCRKNTLIYRTVFACYPDDTVQALAEYGTFKQRQNLEAYEAYKNQIIGNAVEFPLEFLKNENLKIGIFQKEYICPDINFT